MSAVLSCECEGCGAACDGPVTVAGISVALCDECMDEPLYRTRRPHLTTLDRDRAAARDAAVPLYGEF